MSHASGAISVVKEAEKEVQDVLEKLSGEKSMTQLEAEKRLSKAVAVLDMETDKKEEEEEKVEAPKSKTIFFRKEHGNFRS